MKVSIGKSIFLLLALLLISVSFLIIGYSLVKLPQSKVAIVQSSKSNAGDLVYDDVKAMVTEAVNLAGGFDSVIQNGDTVVLKPNLVLMRENDSSSSPLLSKEVNGIATDWRVAKAVVELVRQINPSGKVYIMEGSAVNKTKDVMNHLNYTSSYIPNVDGFIAIEEDSGAWHDYNSAGLSKVTLSNGMLHTEYYLNKKYYDADVLISLPCLKTHSSAGITGALKNTGIGATPGNIYGSSSTSAHRGDMVSHNTLDLHKWIHDYFMCKPINFAITDGLQGLQDGPSHASGSAISTDQMNMRLLLAGKDATAVDTVSSLVMGWDPQSIEHLTYLNSSSAGNLDTSCITVLGKKVDEVRKSFSGNESDSGGRKYSDFTAPTLSVNSTSFEGSTAKLSLSVGSDTVKAEVYIDGKLIEPVITSGYDNISLDIGSLSAGNHRAVIYTYDRFLNHAEKVIPFTNTQGAYLAQKSEATMTIDGKANESCWSYAPWRNIKDLWTGSNPSASDFTGRYKLVWTPQKLYWLLEITDEKLYRPYTSNPLSQYWDNDCLELFIDENKSGGDHTYNYNAFSYHIDLDYNVIDLDTTQNARYYNDHCTAARFNQSGTSVHTWEIAMNVYNDTYNENSTSNVPITLSAGKVMGFAAAYNDNDNSTTRESQIGSIYISGDATRAWKDASVFGSLELDSTVAGSSGGPSPTPTPTPGPTPTPAPTPSPTPTPAPGSVTAVKVSSAPSIDGSLNESTWNISTNVSKVVTGSNNNTVSFGASWDNSYLYVGIKVQDGSLRNDSYSVWDDDAVEIFIDGNHSHSPYYDNYDRRFVKGYNDSTVYEASRRTQGVLHAWTSISGGYSVEMAIPWSNMGITPSAGMTIGLDIGNDDDDNGSGRDGQTVWTGTSNNSMNTANFGHLYLSN